MFYFTILFDIINNIIIICDESLKKEVNTYNANKEI